MPDARIDAEKQWEEATLYEYSSGESRQTASTRCEDNFLVMPKSVYGEQGNIVEQFKDIYTIDFLWDVEKDGVLIYDSK